MTHDRKLQPTDQARTAAAQQPARTLRPIDPADFKHIGGGAPRGGWAETPTPDFIDPVDAPRGGW